MKKSSKIYIAGHNGMVGKSIHNYFIQNRIGRIITENRVNLNLENFYNVDKFIRTLRVYIAFAMFDSIPVHITQDMIDSVYNQVNLLNNNQGQH